MMIIIIISLSCFRLLTPQKMPHVAVCICNVYTGKEQQEGAWGLLANYSSGFGELRIVCETVAEKISWRVTED